jgi:anhydro-N-acetylmuramic acid kinase
MNPALHRLFDVARAPHRRIIGLMSGTSLDGLDVALCRCTGHGPATRVAVEQFTTVPYDEAVKARIRSIFARREVDFQLVTVLNPWIATLHADLVLDCLRTWGVPPTDVDAIASHGQTVFHAPRHQHGWAEYPNATLQLGDGDHLAVRTGILTLSDFRQKHLAAGGEGAPLAVYGDYLLFSEPGRNRVLINLGGIANFTYLPASADADADAVFVTDTGPGNTLLDAFARERLGLPYDPDAATARRGTVHAGLLTELRAHAFFAAPFPKTTGPEQFSADFVRAAQDRTGTTDLPTPDLLATLTRLSAETLAEALRRVQVPGQVYEGYLSGGGVHNPLLVGYLRDLLPTTRLGLTDELGIAGDAKEAVLFAVLANETLAGGQTSFGTRPAVPSVTMGKISLPR